MTTKLPPLPRLSKFSPGRRWRDTKFLMVVETCALLDTLTTLLTFGQVSWELRSWALFDLYGDL